MPPETPSIAPESVTNMACKVFVDGRLATAFLAEDIPPETLDQIRILLATTAGSFRTFTRRWDEPAPDEPH